MTSHVALQGTVVGRTLPSVFPGGFSVPFPCFDFVACVEFWLSAVPWWSCLCIVYCFHHFFLQPEDHFLAPTLYETVFAAVVVPYAAGIREASVDYLLGVASVRDVVDDEQPFDAATSRTFHCYREAPFEPPGPLLHLLDPLAVFLVAHVVPRVAVFVFDDTADAEVDTVEHLEEFLP